MNTINRALAAASLCSLVLVTLPSNAGEKADDHVLMKMADSAPDGKVTKAQVMKKVEEWFNKHDTRKEGKLDKKQMDWFLKEFTRESGG